MADVPMEPAPPGEGAPTPPAEIVADVPPPEKSHAQESLKKIIRDFGKGTKDLLRFVFVEHRAERRKELVESLRFYVTYK